MSIFTSAFAAKLDAMVEYRKIRGYRAETYSRSLLNFDSYCREQCVMAPELTSELVSRWLESEARGISDRAMAIRQFGKYLCAVGEDAYILPDKSTFGISKNAVYFY